MNRIAENGKVIFFEKWETISLYKCTVISTILIINYSIEDDLWDKGRFSRPSTSLLFSSLPYQSDPRRHSDFLGSFYCLNISWRKMVQKITQRRSGQKDHR